MTPPAKRAHRPFIALRNWAVVVATLFLGAGCATGPGRGGGIDSLHVFSVPVAFDLDNSPGPDGFGVTLYASAAGAAKGVAITSGRMEVLMFDGALATDAKSNAPPRQTWTFTSDDLKRHVIKTSLGTGYRFTPQWGAAPPARDLITIIVRYVSARETVIQSAPTSITIGVK